MDAVNQVFASIMSMEFGEMDYGQKEFLVAGGEGKEERGERREESCGAEINVIDMSAVESDDEDSISKTQVEARFIAERIKEIVDSGIRDSLSEDADEAASFKPIRYSDIVILLRSIKNKAWQYGAALSELGIPSDMPGGEGFYETIEISTALSILKVIDNPMQDIPLAAALRSPVYGFSADELAVIRLYSPTNDFYTALTLAAETNEKCQRFLSEINSLRALAPDLPADRFIWHMYNKTGLLARMGALRNGEHRRENLILLAENARNLEQSGYKGLFGFLSYIVSQQEKGIEPIREVSLSEQNAVKIMSIHKSKGLEFPVVFLANTASKVNNRDAQKPLLVHAKFGVGAKLTDLERRIKYTTLSREAIRGKLTLENMAEELRVLYVAMTRAKEKLFIVSTFNNASRELDKYSKLAKGFSSQDTQQVDQSQYTRIAPQVLMDVDNMAGWVLLAAFANEDGKLKVVSVEERGERREERVESGELRVEGGKLRNEGGIELHLNEIIERFSFEYPFKNAPNHPSKLTVTELKGKLSNFDSDDMAASLIGIHKDIYEKNDLVKSDFGEKFESQTSKSLKFAYERPSFILQKTGLTAAERGTAMHQVMQYIDLAACENIELVEREIGKLADRGFLSREQADVVDAQKVLNFFESDIGQRMLKSQNLRREFKFSLLYDAKLFFPDIVCGSECENGGSGDKIFVQGVVDCFFEENGELVVLDFKSDYVTEETIEDKVLEYEPQIFAYAEALERITDMHVKERVIYFFGLDRACII